MNFIFQLSENKKTKILIWILSVILLVIIILNSFYPRKITFNNYYMILTHIIAIYWFIHIFKFIFNENSNSFKISLLDSRIFFLIALALLFYTPFYILLENKKTAENLSIYAYSFLVIWVIYEIILSKFENKINALQSSALANKKVKERKKERKEKLAWKRKLKKK
jgi:hypothetical protein